MSTIKISKNNHIYNTQVHFPHVYPSELYKELDNPSFLEVEKEINNKCISQKSIYDICEKKNINGLEVCILKAATQNLMYSLSH